MFVLLFPLSGFSVFVLPSPLSGFSVYVRPSTISVFSVFVLLSSWVNRVVNGMLVLREVVSWGKVEKCLRGYIQ